MYTPAAAADDELDKRPASLSDMPSPRLPRHPDLLRCYHQACRLYLAQLWTYMAAITYLYPLARSSAQAKQLAVLCSDQRRSYVHMGAMSRSPRALKELMTAVDRNAVDVVYADSVSSDSSNNKLLGPRRRRLSTTHYGGGGARKQSAPAVAVVAAAAASSDASFEFSTAVLSYSSASPASMVFSDGQIRAHQFPAVRSSASTDSSQATSPLRSSSTGSSYSSGTNTKQQQQQQAGVTVGSKKRVSFATDGADNKAAAGKAGGGQGMKKSGGLLGCMGSACGPSSRKEAVQPVARNDNRKLVAF